MVIHKMCPYRKPALTLVSELRLFKRRRPFFCEKSLHSPTVGLSLSLPALVRFACWLDENILSKVVFSDSSNASASGGGDLGEAV